MDTFPWEAPPLDSWYIVCLNHQIRYNASPGGPKKETGVFCCMTRGTRCIEAHGPDAHSVFMALARKAQQLDAAGM